MAIGAVTGVVAEMAETALALPTAQRRCRLWTTAAADGWLAARGGAHGLRLLGLAAMARGGALGFRRLVGISIGRFSVILSRFDRLYKPRELPAERSVLGEQVLKFGRDEPATRQRLEFVLCFVG